MAPLGGPILSTVILAMSSASFGISLTSANPIEEKFADDSQFTLIVAMVYFGAIFSNFFIRRFRIGERSKLFAANLLFITGYFSLLCDIGISTAIASRFTIGLGVGIVNAVVPLYISSISPEDIKGVLTAMNTLGCASGIVLGHYLNIFYDYELAYKIVIAYTAIQSILLLLVQCSDHASSVSSGSILDLFRSTKARKSIMIASALHIGQHFSGINYMVIFLGRLFPDRLAPVKFNSVAVVVTFFSGFLLNRFGRKSMMIFSCMSVILAFGLLLTEKANSAAAILYFVGFNCGLNSVPWSAVDEVFEESYIDAGSLMSVTLNYLCAFIMIAGVSILDKHMGRLSVLFYMVSMAILTVLIMFSYTPNTVAKRVSPIN